MVNLIQLSETQIAAFSRLEAEEKLLYLRYLVMREKDVNQVTRYHQYIDKIESRIAILNQEAQALD